MKIINSLFLLEKYLLRHDQGKKKVTSEFSDKEKIRYQSPKLTNKNF